MRFPNSSSPQTWRDHNQQGKDAYNAEQYELALQEYRTALHCTNPTPSNYDKQLLLSNIVACRLKLASPAHLEIALEEARQCVALNPEWAKAHVRLGNVYQALHQSNNACQAFQRALQLDPTNPTARAMLTQELRRGTRSTTGNTTAPQSSNPPTPPTSQTSFDGVDESRSLLDNLKCYMKRCTSWYSSQSDDVKALLKVCLGLLILYVAFGGRFGFGQPHRPGHQYNHYYQSDDPPKTKSTNSRKQSNTYTSNPPRYQNEYTDDHTSDPYFSNQSWTDYQIPYLFDGSLFSMIILASIAYAAHKMGISPFQVIWMLNMMQGGRRGGGFRTMGMGRAGFGRRRW